MNEFIYGMVAGFITKLVQKPEKKRKMRNISLQIFNALKAAYAGDEGFQ